MVRTEAGEDITVFCPACVWAQNKEIAEWKAKDKCPQCGKKLEEVKTVEAGNIFNLGTEYSKKMCLKFTAADGRQKEVIMGCYGIGLGRLMGTIVEVSHDQDGIIWTKNSTPYQVHLLNLARNVKTGEEVYQKLMKEGWQVLYDDRDISHGKKLKDADLIGICYQLIVSDQQKELELIHRSNHKKVLAGYDKVAQELAKFYR